MTSCRILRSHDCNLQCLLPVYSKKNMPIWKNGFAFTSVNLLNCGDSLKTHRRKCCKMGSGHIGPSSYNRNNLGWKIQSQLWLLSQGPSLLRTNEFISESVVLSWWSIWLKTCHHPLRQDLINYLVQCLSIYYDSNKQGVSTYSKWSALCKSERVVLI